MNLNIVTLTPIGHLANDVAEIYPSIEFPANGYGLQIVSLVGAAFTCMAYVPKDSKQGVICYVNDGDARTIALNQNA